MSNRILLFEDNPISSKLMKMFLEQSGYFVDMALSLDQLYAKVANNFKVVFIDTSSPALTKDKIIEFVTSSKKSEFFDCPPLVAIMNNAKDIEISFYMSIGMDGYIVKPISVKSLREVIDKVAAGVVVMAPDEDMADVEKVAKALGIPNEKLILQLFEQFFVTASNELRQMRVAMNNKDYETIKKLAHSIKGAAKNLRLSNIGKVAEELETHSKYPSETTDIKGMIVNLDNACMRVYNDFTNRYSE